LVAGWWMDGMGHWQFGFVLMGMLSSPSDVRRFEIISPRQVCEELASENCPQFASSCYYNTLISFLM
jgi:hypothetical protein